MYSSNDLRSTMASSSAKRVPTSFASADYGKHYETKPDETSANGSTWYTRGQNFLVAVTEAKPGWTFERKGQVDEYVIMLGDEKTEVILTTPTETKTAKGEALIIMPPGDSRIEVKTKGTVVHLFTTQSADLAAKCSNSASYAQPDPNVPPFEPWPAPPAGYKIRVYGIDVPKQEGRFGRLFRCTTFMVNWFEPRLAPRETTAMSPHHHDDFQQCSLILAGKYTHHLRWPWTTDMSNWREDEHETCGAPSVTIIPAGVVHTSAALENYNILVDIFSPPRVDFSSKPGWVLNADEYPMPSEASR